jgi:hypothetical protein
VKIVSYVFYTAIGMLIALAIFVTVFRLARRFGGSLGATAASAAANVTGTNI